MKDQITRWSTVTTVLLVLGLLAGLAVPDGANAQTCTRTVIANVVALDQNFFLNRLGSLNNLGMIYALERDVYTNAFNAQGEFIGQPCNKSGVNCQPGQVVLRPDKRPRPISLRVSKGDCLQINFRNLLRAAPIDPNEQPVTREASAHVTGLPLVGGISSDGSFVGQNGSSLVAPGGRRTYTYYAIDENVYMITNMGATTGAEGAGGTLTFGLYGVVIVEPGIPGNAGAAAEYYRSHVTNEDMTLATSGTAPDGHPIINYDASYPNQQPFISENKANLPVLSMLCTPAAASAGVCVKQGTTVELVHSDVNAVITGPNKGKFVAGSTYPSTATNPRQDLPFRDSASVFGDEHFNVQSFPFFFTNPVLKHTLAITKDGFVINYASGAIGPEIIANRLGVGPMWDCPECKAEEFFLTSWAVGDPGMWVDLPANGCVQNNRPLVGGVAVSPAITPETGAREGASPIACDLTPGPKATAAIFPDDPSTVHHAYIRDHFKFRNIHAGPFEHHIFHLHGNQWVFSPKSDKANYMDMQQIGPGSAYTFDIVNEGVGNRNASPGDAIYHCHFYPHFAQGMWSSLRMLDVFAEGTVLNPRKNAQGVRLPWALRDAPPARGSRAYPDGEVRVAAVPGQGTCLEDPNFDGLCTGTPVPGVVPIPMFPMAPMPQPSFVDPVDPRRVIVDTTVPVIGNPEKNPGFPFYIAGVAGHRPPSPPLDLVHDGGLPRHVITGGTAISALTRFDINKELEHVEAELVPETGSASELASFAFHENRCHDTFYPDGFAAVCDTAALNALGKPFRGGFITNGLPPQPGSPHADPCVDNMGNPVNTGSTPIWNSPECSIARDDNPNPACTGFTLPVTAEFGGDQPRPYKITAMQIDVVLNKKGWHMPQQRIVALWGDVADLYSGKKPAEPMVFRLNTLDCAQAWHSNLVPNFFELDDFQVRTPTDIIAQHTHMEKFDMSSADGAANLWNYEDGTMSPGEVAERIIAINRAKGLIVGHNPDGTPIRQTLTAETHPFFENQDLPFQTVGVAGCSGKTCGARTTVQRWFADPVFDSQGIDRGVGNVFTHDHLGPSTFQQLGLYATILVEPARSQWRHNETGAPLATRVGPVDVLTNDGGPTSWQAQIIPPANSGHFNKDPFREFYFESSDFQQSYKRSWGGSVSTVSFLDAVHPTPRAADLVHSYAFENICPGGVPRPCPMGIGGADLGTFVVNYRSEPVGARIFDPVRLTQAAGRPGDLGFAFASIQRADPELNIQIPSCVRRTIQCPSCIAKPGEGTGGLDPFVVAGLLSPLPNPTPAGIGPELPCPQISADVGPLDPGTPMMRVYEGDKVKIRYQVGATEESHHFSLHGAKWLMNYADPNSGWRNFQSMGISEQFQFDFPVLGDLVSEGAQRQVDFLYSTNMSSTGLWTGTWGLMRAYNQLRTNLAPLPGSIAGNRPIEVVNKEDFDEFEDGVCPENAPVRRYDVTAIRAADIPLPTRVNGVSTLIYNARTTVVPDNIIPAAPGEPAQVIPGGQGPLHDPTAILYVQTTDLPALRNGTLRPEPLILRANAGDCIDVTLRNRLPNVVPDLFSLALTYDPVIDLCPNGGCPVTAPARKTSFNSNDIVPSSHVGLHAQLVAADTFTQDGTNVGSNPVQTAPPGGTVKYRWYAGDFQVERLGTTSEGAPLVSLIPRPIEFGVVGLSPADKLEQASKGLIGALMIEPRGSRCIPDAGTRAQANCAVAGGQSYREFVAVTQSAVNMKFANPDPDPRFQFRSVPGMEPVDPIIGYPEDAEDSGIKAVNYRSEPYWFRLRMAPSTPVNGPNGQQSFPTGALYSNRQVNAEPQTPIFRATRGQNFRFYFVEPTGNQRSAVPVIHGHPWQRIPHQTPFGGAESAVIGLNPQSQVVGSQEGYGPASHWNFIPVVPAGGPFGVAGDYLYRMQSPVHGYEGSWGLFRVQ